MIELGPITLDLMPWILAIGAILLRLFGLLHALPFWSQTGVPMQAKVFSAIFLSMATWYALMMPAIPLPDGPGGWVLILAPELVIGAAIGMIIRVVVQAALGVGQIVTNTIGLGFATFVDPDVGSTTSLGRLLLTVVGLLLVVSNIHLELFDALIDTFKLVGPGQALPLLFSKGLYEIAALGGHFMSLSLRLAAPVMATSLMIYTVLAVVARVAPQMNLFAFGFIVTIPTGLIILALEMPHALGLFSSELATLPETIVRWVATGRTQ